MKLKLSGRLLGLSRDIGYYMEPILKDIERAFNEVEEVVLPSAVHSSPVTADTLIKTGKTIFRGFNVTTVTAAGTIDIRDATSAGTGTIIQTLAAGTAVGVYEKQVPIICETGLYVDYNAGPATGTLVILYE